MCLLDKASVLIILWNSSDPTMYHFQFHVHLSLIIGSDSKSSMASNTISPTRHHRQLSSQDAPIKMNLVIKNILGKSKRLTMQITILKPLRSSAEENILKSFFQLFLLSNHGNLFDQHTSAEIFVQGEMCSEMLAQRMKFTLLSVHELTRINASPTTYQL